MSNIVSKMRGLSRIVVATTLVAGSFLGAGRAAHATPSTLGFYPSTDFYGKGTFHFDFDSYSKSLTNNFGTTAGIEYGAGPDRDGFFGRTEAGFDYSFNNSGGVDAAGAATTNSVRAGNRIGFNAKTQLFNNDASGTRVVIGTWGLGTRDGGFPNYIYLLGSKTFGNAGRVHLGVANATRKAIVGRNRTSLQLGYDKYITPKLQFAVDYYTGKGALSGVQPTLYYYINDKANFGLGYFRLNDNNAAVRDQVYLCFDYNFDFKGPSVTTTTPTPETVPGAPASN